MKKTLIIAEAGVNHNGSLALAMQLVEHAAKAGADFIKFQTFKSEKLVSHYAVKAEYQKKALQDEDDSQLHMLKRLELSEEEHVMLKEHCNRCGIGFLSTAFDESSIDFLRTLNMDYWKIPSGEITNYPYLIQIARIGGKVILSTGMSNIEEIASAIGVLEKNGVSKKDITLLHCNTEYPTPWQDVNLRAMLHLADSFGVSVGYSDHTCGIEVPIAAVALGATVIEKHFTLNRNLEGPDHKASLEPQELKEMIKAIRHIELALGSGQKMVTDSERKNMAIARKSIVAACRIQKGERLTIDNLTVKRPGTGLSPMRWEDVLGTCAIRDFDEDELIEIE